MTIVMEVYGGSICKEVLNLIGSVGRIGNLHRIYSSVFNSLATNAPMVHTDTLGSTALFHTNVIHCLLREVGAVLIQISQNASDG